MSNLRSTSTSKDIAKLLELAAAGATLLRASAALRRPASSVTKKATELGKSFPGAQRVRALLRASGAIETLANKNAFRWSTANLSHHPCFSDESLNGSGPEEP